MGADESVPLSTPGLPPAATTLGGGFHRGNIHRRLDVLLDALEQHGATAAVGEEGRKRRQQLSDLARMEWAQIDAAVLEHIARVTGLNPAAVHPDVRGLSPPLQYHHDSTRRRRRKRSKHHRSPSPISVTSSTTSATATASSSDRSPSPYTSPSPSPSPPPSPPPPPLKQWSRPSVSPPPSTSADANSSTAWLASTNPMPSPSRTSSVSPEPRWIDVDKMQNR